MIKLAPLAGVNLTLPKPVCCTVICAVCGMYCGVDRVFKDVSEREEACVRGQSVVVQVVIPSKTRTWSCLKLIYQPSAQKQKYSRPPQDGRQLVNENSIKK